MSATSPTGLREQAGKIIAVHLNYRSRAAQRGRTPAQPSYFFKPTSSLAAAGSELERPAGTELLAFEGEIALIIGRTTRRVSPEAGWAAVSGVTAANDFGLYDLRAADKGSNVRSKGGDGFTPVGPGVLPAADLDPDALRVRTWLNGELVQEGTTDDLLFSFGRLIADLSQLMTLEPGDIILTGTPAGSSVTQPGDTVEVEVDAPTAPGAPSTGRLVTRITEGSIPFGDFGTKPSVDDHQRAEAWGTPPEPAWTLSDELRSKLASVATATLSSQLRKRGLNNVSIDGLTSTRPGTKVVGTARTLRYIPNREDLFATRGGGYNAQKRAFDAVGPGEVLVIEARGERSSGTVGDVLALRAQVNGAAGIVTDGG
ncbi:MAG: fumarylacetoacetate hydrolase family protein, partial [Leifsonia sp.]|nr:fumarylacetoacetate hydrolase family protein [Leifsonia sp.]